MLKIVFPIFRTPFLRTLGPMIEQVADDPEMSAVILIKNQSVSGIKAYQQPTTDNLPHRLRGKTKVISVDSSGEFFEELLKADSVISNLGRRFLVDMIRPETSDSLNALTQQQLDSLHWIMIWDADHSTYASHAPFDADTFCVPGPYSLTNVLDRNPDQTAKLESITKVTGPLKFDQIRGLSRADIRDEWNVPQSDCIILVVPDSYILRDGNCSFTNAWYRTLWSKKERFSRILGALLYLRTITSIKEAFNTDLSYPAVLKTTREFADRQNAKILLARRRRKDTESGDIFTSEERQISDHIVDEDEDYPQSLLKAIVASDLVICLCHSETVVDAAMAGVPYISVVIPKHKGYNLASDRIQSYLCSFEKGRGNWPGVNWLFEADDFVHKAACWKIDNFDLDTEQHNLYLGQFAAISEIGAGNQILGFIRLAHESGL